MVCGFAPLHFFGCRTSDQSLVIGRISCHRDRSVVVETVPTCRYLRRWGSSPCFVCVRIPLGPDPWRDLDNDGVSERRPPEFFLGLDQSAWVIHANRNIVLGNGSRRQLPLIS